VKVLHRAAELAPGDSKTLLHLARALADTGSIDESKAVMERFRNLGPEKHTVVHGGFVEYLSLTPEQRRADYRARVEKAVRAHPDDAALQLDYLKLLVENGDRARLPAVARALAALKPPEPVLADGGRALLSAGENRLAREFLAGAASPALQVELAVAAFRDGDASQAVRVLDHIPEAARDAEYYLARAEMRDDAFPALLAAVNSTPQRADVYRRAAALLTIRGRASDALTVLDRAASVLPQDREILLRRAVAAELAGRSADADRWLVEIRTRWPEWGPGWLAGGIVLDRRGHSDEARKALETAAALGESAHQPSLSGFLTAR
jgi:Flp pilus assembly protein TadD